MKTNKKFYIGERENPQLSKSYYVAFGQLSKKEAQQKENTSYGSIWLSSFDDEASYLKKIEDLKKEGFTVNYR